MRCTCTTGCVNDAIAIQKEFREQKGLLYKDVVGYLLTEEKGTWENIFLAIKKIDSLIRPNDFFILYHDISSLPKLDS